MRICPPSPSPAPTSLQPSKLSQKPSHNSRYLEPGSTHPSQTDGYPTQSEVHAINEETKGDVSSWVTNAKTLQEDILRSKRLADDIVRQSEAPDVSGKAIHDAEEHISFLQKEVAYSNQLHEALTGIRHVNEILSEVEQAMHERRILDALRWLESMDTGPVV